MADIFTHSFKFQLDDGGKFINGKVEFNLDGEMSYHFEEISVPFKDQTLTHFSILMNALKEIFYVSGGIKLIRIKKIE